MVPLADIFNHKAAIVQLSDEYAIEPACFDEGDTDEEASEEDEPEGSGKREGPPLSGCYCDQQPKHTSNQGCGNGNALR